MTGVPTLRDRIALLIRRNTMRGIAAEVTAGAITDMAVREAATRCRDKDCARILPHGRLARHLKRHKAEPPFDHILFGWLCGSCGLRRRHRVHRVRAQAVRERTAS